MVPPHLELELRFGLAPERIAELAVCEWLQPRTVAPLVSRQLHSIYFDNDKLSLRRRGFALRVRNDGTGWLQTLKRSAQASPILWARDEYEAPVAFGAPDLDAIPDLEVREQLQKWTRKRALVAIFETRVRRTTRRLQLGATTCLLEIDVGELRARDAVAPICELELELERGDPARLFELAAELNAAIGLRFESDSKADRGYALYAGERAGSQRAAAIELDPQSDLGDGMTRIASSCAAQIVANISAARDGVDPEGVHQLRVGVRRLRAALGAFKEVLPAQEWMSLRRELRWLGIEAGHVRDMDVFVEEQLVPAARFIADPKPLDSLAADAASMRSKLQAELRETLASARFARLMLALGQWLQRFSTEGLGRTVYRERLSRPVSELAAAALARGHARARELGERAASGSIADRHALRIELKKLRYVAEFFAALYPKKRGRRFLREMERLQEVLGCLNDVETARRLAREIAERADAASRSDLERGASVIEGWTAQLAARSEQKLSRCWQRFGAVRPFWES
jgi:inorganic triphosphatase YgiF